MVRRHRLWYERTLSVSEHCETTTNQSQDSCLEHFRSISLLDFEFRKNFSCQAPVFFSEGVRIFCRRDYFGNRLIYVQTFLFWQQCIFCVPKSTFLHRLALLCQIQINSSEKFENGDYISTFGLKQNLWTYSYPRR